MKLVLASTALAVAFAVAPAAAQPPAAEEKSGTLVIEGVEPSKVLGAIDPTKLVDEPAEQPAPVAENTQPPQPQTQVTVDTEVTDTPTAVVETRTEIIAPAPGPQLDAEHPIAPEVQAVVNAKKNYTTADIVKAQHEAMMRTAPTVPTTTVTTTTTTPKAPG